MDFPRPAAQGAIGAPMLRYPHARTGHWLNWQSTGLQNRGLQVRVLRAPLLRPSASRPSVTRYPPAGRAGEVLWLHKSLPSF